MLTIRDAQLEALRRGVVVRTLAEGLPEVRRRLGRAAFRAAALDALDRAAALGFAAADHGPRLARLLVAGGPAALEHPDAAAILAWQAPPELRLLALEERAARRGAVAVAGALVAGAGDDAGAGAGDDAGAGAGPSPAGDPDAT